jgi:hypothetical protein
MGTKGRSASADKVSIGSCHLFSPVPPFVLLCFPKLSPDLVGPAAENAAQIHAIFSFIGSSMDARNV